MNDILPSDMVAKEIKSRIYVVDDSREMCRSLDALLTAYGYDVLTFESASAFLSRSQDLDAGVLLVDLRMEDVNGLELIQKLGSRIDKFVPVMISAHGDIETAVQAIKSGAKDFIQKPFQEASLIETIERAADDLREVAREPPTGARDVLTGREREVAERLAKGLLNKQIAYELGISVRTVEMHRANAMQRLGCKSFADFLRLLLVN